MNPQFRSTSYSSSIVAPPTVRRPSVGSRLSFAVSTATAERGEGQNGQGIAAQHQIEEEIAKIKRYEDFTTIDWVQDAAREQLRRKSRRKRTAGLYDTGQFDWKQRILESYEAAQGWIVVTIIGAAIGMNAAFLNIITEWLADIKLGHCKTGFYLNENFCCWGEDNGCADWERWTGLEPINYFLYIVFAVGLPAASFSFPLPPSPVLTRGHRSCLHSLRPRSSNHMPHTPPVRVSRRSNVSLLVSS